jgi:cytoskeleton protein RodZ
VAPPPSSEEAEQPIPELRRLGQQLAQARQAAGLSAEDLSQRLCLAPRQLLALEAGDHTRLPEGVFVVGMARRVAGVLHADLDEAILAVRQSRLMRCPLPASSPGPARSRPPAAGPKVPELRCGLLAALIAACGLAAAWLLFPQLSPRRLFPTPVHPKSQPVQDQARGPSSPVSALAPADTVEPEILRLDASEPSWVEVREVDGRTLFEGTLSTEKRFPLGRGIEVIAGRPHAVRAAIGPAAGAPLGGVADIRWKRFSPAGLRPESPSSASSTP